MAAIYIVLWGGRRAKELLTLSGFETLWIFHLTTEPREGGHSTKENILISRSWHVEKIPSLQMKYLGLNGLLKGLEVTFGECNLIDERCWGSVKTTFSEITNNRQCYWGFLGDWVCVLDGISMTYCYGR